MSTQQQCAKYFKTRVIIFALHASGATPSATFRTQKTGEIPLVVEKNLQIPSQNVIQYRDSGGSDEYAL